MDKLFRFSDYDVFGYLGSGVILLALCDAAIGSQIVWKEQWSISSAVAVIIGGYILGHIVSGVAAGVVDRTIVRKLFGTTADMLMTIRRKPGWIMRFILGEFIDPINESLRARIIQRAGMTLDESKKSGAGEKIFWRAWPILKRDSIAYGRAETFLKLYGFCRTVSFIGFVGALVFLAQAALGWPQPQLPRGTCALCSLALIVVSLGMYRRYLRFLRLYSMEVFSTFAESEPKPA